MTEPPKAIFLSYASQDAEAARRICETLRAAGIPVWFDQSELRGGDVWDPQIREQIHDCRLFIPVISANTEARDEGYFRREWNLAVDRTHDMAERRAFIVPVVIDATTERGTSVPEKFRELQWTRLPDGETPPAFVEQVRRLLSPDALSARAATTPFGSTSVPISPISLHRSWRSKVGLWITGAVLAAALAYIAVDKFLDSRHLPLPTPPLANATQTATAASAAAAAFNPPPHSIAVLPFANLSGDKDQEYFSDGLTEELLNSLTRINELQVAARTSSFSFQGEHPDIATVAHKLNVGAVLEGSVRRSEHTVRVTAQLINGVTGFHIWSQTYDRDLGDVLALQSDIANAVAAALKVTLFGDTATKIELGGTRNPVAFDAYLKGSQAFRMYHQAKDLKTAIEAYTDAIQLDPNYPLAYVGRSRALDELASWWIADAVESRAKALADARKAVALAPDLGEAHLVLANSLSEQLDFARASEEYERALALAPGNALVLQDYGLFAVLMGHTDQGLSAGRRAVLLDPLNRTTHLVLFDALGAARQQEQAISVLQDALVLDSTYYPFQWGPYYALGSYQTASTMCETNPRISDTYMCLALVYDKLGRHADAERALEKFKTANSDDWYHFAEIYAQWGETTKAVSSLEAALRIRHDGLMYLKTDWFLDPLRQEPRFQAIERALRFPD